LGSGKENIAEERRRFPRVHPPPIVLYRFVDGVPPLGVKRPDISKGGICLLLPEDPKEKVIQLMIYLPNRPIPISAKGKGWFLVLGILSYLLSPILHANGRLVGYLYLIRVAVNAKLSGILIEGCIAAPDIPLKGGGNEKGKLSFYSLRVG